MNLKVGIVVPLNIFFLQYVSGGVELMIFENKGTDSPHFQK